MSLAKKTGAVEATMQGDWHELSNNDRWNPAYFGDTPRLIEQSGQMSIFFDPAIEPPLPEECRSLEEFNRLYHQWEINYGFQLK